MCKTKYGKELRELKKFVMEKWIGLILISVPIYQTLIMAFINNKYLKYEKEKKIRLRIRHCIIGMNMRWASYFELQNTSIIAAFIIYYIDTLFFF